MAPGVPLVLAPEERPFAILKTDGQATCPTCEATCALPHLGKGKRKKVALSLLVHPQWLEGASSTDLEDQSYGGSVTDDAVASARWYRVRAEKLRLLEVRGALPESVTCPETGVSFKTSEGTVPKRSHYACGACGAVQDVLTTVKASGKTGPVAPYAIQAYSPARDCEGSAAYRGRYFLPTDDSRVFEAAQREWESRKDGDLARYWPRSELPYGFMTHMLNGGIPNHGFTHWWTMFNPRQLLANALLLKSIATTGTHRWEVREFVLAAFQQYLRNQSMLSFWHLTYDKLAPGLSNGNFHPKSTVVEVGVFPPMGYGPWTSTVAGLHDALDWTADPWELVSNEWLIAQAPNLAESVTGKSEKCRLGDPVGSSSNLSCASATDLTSLRSASVDLVITDPPFGGLVHYSELADFFYVWLRLVLKDRYPEQFEPEYTPKTLEAVSNRARHPDDADAFYQRLLTASWKEAHRILKPGGTLAFTFHHSEDAPWVAVLESLFEAGFYLEATYPIRSDETKGDGEFGSKTIEYDIIHVCRKRLDEPKPVSWARMRRQVLQDVLGLKQTLEHHHRAGLPEADLQVIRRGKALEYYSRHYGQVFVSAEQRLGVAEALIGINELLEVGAGTSSANPPPDNAHPTTRQLLRLFDKTAQRPRDEVHKLLRGTGLAPSDLIALGWCREEKKVFHLVPHLELARTWHGKHRKGIASDYEQAAFLIGACFEGSGIDVSKTLRNEQFKPHPALEALLEWFGRQGADLDARSAAQRALTLFRTAKAKAEIKAPENYDLFAELAGA